MQRLESTALTRNVDKPREERGHIGLKRSRDLDNRRVGRLPSTYQGTCSHD